MVFDQYADLLRAQGDNPDELRASTSDTPQAADLLGRFAEIAAAPAKAQS